MRALGVNLAIDREESEYKSRDVALARGLSVIDGSKL